MSNAKNPYRKTPDSLLEQKVKQVREQKSSLLDFEKSSDPIIQAIRESIALLPELQTALRTLSGAGSQYISCEQQYGKRYPSRDFRIRENADEHMKTLSKYWSNPEHSSHKTFKILKRLHEERQQKEQRVKTMWALGVRSTDNDLSTESIWRNIKGIDVILRGFVLSREKSEDQQALEKEIIKNAGALSLESIGNMRSGQAMTALLKHPELGLPHQVLLQEALKLNPDLVLVDIEPRNDGHIRYLELFNENTLPEEFYQQYYDFLLAQDPGLEKVYESVDELKAMLANLNEENLRRLPHQSFAVKKGIDFQPFLSAKKLEGAGWGFSNHLMEPHIGPGEFTGAAMAWQILRAIEEIDKQGIRLDGPLVLNRDPFHIQAIAHFLDHPDEMIRCLLMHPHLGTLPATDAPQRDLTREENTERIQKELAAGVLNENPFEEIDRWGTYKALEDFSITKVTPEGIDVLYGIKSPS